MSKTFSSFFHQDLLLSSSLEEQETVWFKTETLLFSLFILEKEEKKIKKRKKQWGHNEKRLGITYSFFSTQPNNTTQLGTI
jgi:hypothetical protein